MLTETPKCAVTCNGVTVDIRSVIEIAELATKAILNVYNDEASWNVVEKSDGAGPLTRADTEANDIIVSSLLRLYPSIPIVSEEEKEIPWDSRKLFDYFWCIDPLDGTKEFIKRNGQFTLNIGLCHDSVPIAGVVTIPTLGETYYAAVGQGAYKVTIDEGGRKVIQRIRAASFRQSDAGLKILGNSNLFSKRGKEFTEQLDSPVLEQLGSSIKILRLAEGYAHIYPRFWPSSEWDTAAAHAILNEAGGRILQASGGEPADEESPLVYNKKNLLNPFFVAYGAKE